MTDTRRIRLWIAATSAAIAAASPPARAQSAEAQALFDDGNKLIKQGKIGEACEAFDASNRLEARAGTLIRLGECREQNHQLASAWSAYRDALGRAKDPKKKQIATARIAELEPKLSYMTVAVPEASGLDGLELVRDGQPIDVALWNRAVPTNGGTYTIVARAPHHAEWTTTVTVPETRGKIVVDVPKLDAAAADTKPEPTRPVRPEPPHPPPHDVAPAISTTSPWTGKRKAAVVLVGGGVLAGATGILLGVAAKSKEHRAFELCPDPAMPCADAKAANDTLATGHHFATAANITYAVSAIAIVAGGVLWLTGAPERAGVAIVPTASADRAGLAVIGAF